MFGSVQAPVARKVDVDISYLVMIVGKVNAGGRKPQVPPVLKAGRPKPTISTK